MTARHLQSAGVAAALADAGFRAELGTLPEATVRSAKAHVIDGVAVTISGLGAPATEIGRRFIAGGRTTFALGDRSRLGVGDLWPPRRPSPALVDVEQLGYLAGVAAGSENYSDTSLRSVAHPDSVVVPAAFAASWHTAVSGGDFLAAIVGGYQVMEYLARSLNGGTPRMAHQGRGFRATSSCGPAGAAFTVAHLLGHDPATTAKAIAVACNLASGLRRTDSSDISTICLHSGEAVAHGVEALRLLDAGVHVDDAIIEGSGGFFTAFAGGELDATAATYLDPAGPWAIDEVAFKFHATPHTFASGLDAAIDLHRAHGEVVARSDAVRIYAPRAHAAFSLEKAAWDLDRITSMTLSDREALESYRFTVAIALATGSIIWPAMAHERLRDRSIGALAARVTVIADDEQSARLDHDPTCWPVRVECDTAEGTISADRRVPRGVDLDAELEHTLEAKFRTLTAHALDDSHQHALLSLLWSLDECADVHREVLAVLAP